MSCLTTIFSYIYRKKRPADIFRRAFPSEIGKIRRFGTLAESRSAATAEWDCFSRCGSEAAVAQTVLLRFRFRVPARQPVSGAKVRRRGGEIFRYERNGGHGGRHVRDRQVCCYGFLTCSATVRRRAEFAASDYCRAGQRFGSGRRPVRSACRGGTPKIGRTEEQSGSPREPEVGR